MVCPRCGKDDQIFKVKGLYERGLSIGSYSGMTAGVNLPTREINNPSVFVGRTTLHGSSQTLLSQKLSPPTKPEKPGGPISMGCCGFFFGSLLGGMVAFLFSSNTQEPSNIIAALLLYGPIILFTFIGVRLGKKSRIKYSQQVEIWNKQMEIWERLYYCARDNCIFDPINKISDVPENINILINAIIRA